MDQNYKITVIGSSGVGKTSLVTKYKDDQFNPDIAPTIGSSQITLNLNVDGNEINLIIWDTAGQEKFEALSPLYLRGSNAVIIVYSVDDRSSFDSVNKWYNIAKDNVQNILYFLVANKYDLYDENDSNHVSIEEGKNKADSLEAYFEYTSALNGLNVKALFESIAKSLSDSRPSNESCIKINDETQDKESDQQKRSCC